MCRSAYTGHRTSLNANRKSADAIINKTYFENLFCWQSERIDAHRAEFGVVVLVRPLHMSNQHID
jgi:hypothetical protein